MSEAIQQAPTNGAQNNSTALATTKPATPQTTENNAAMNPFASGANFEVGQRMATALSKSNTIPKEYQGNIPNCMVALEMAARIGATPLAVMQNLHIIQGRPSWSSSFLIATLNTSKRFGPVRFRWEDNGQPTTPTNCGARGDTFGCRAVAKDLETGEECIGALVSWAMVKAEGWHSKSGSKWKTMPEQMFMYRAAAFFSRIYAPELSLGMQTQDEVIDTTGYTVSETTVPLRSGATADLNAALLSAPAVPESGPKAVEHDEDGVVVESEVTP